MVEEVEEKGFGVYLHWPFCAAKCPYCDFNSHVSKSVDIQAWEQAFATSIAAYQDALGPKNIQSIYFGGGTPSLMPPSLVETIISRLQDRWSLSNAVEITLEANPTSVEASRFRGYRAAGVNRVSMGIQALDNPSLKRLGRLHTVEEALAAWDTANSIFERSSFDLIYGRQDQTLADWETELTWAIRLSNKHLSLYQLTIEDGTAFGDRFKLGKLRGLPDEDKGADFYELTQNLTQGASLPAYEVSNHGETGHESAHNQLYWSGGSYLGIGPGAHGRLRLGTARVATETPLLPDLWLKRVSENGTGELCRTPLSASDRLNERLMMGLRTSRGIEEIELVALGFDNHAAIDRLMDYGMVAIEQGSLLVTKQGRPVLDAILRELLTDPAS